MNMLSDNFQDWKSKIEKEIQNDTEEMKEINGCEDAVYQKILERLEQMGYRFGNE